MIPITSSAPPAITGRPGQATDDTRLRDAAVKLESVFLAEMLKSAGFGKPRDSFGGGAGEDQFGSLLVRAQAEQMARAGGIGLAESLFEALKAQADAK